MHFGMQLVHDLLINLHSNNHHLISYCCHGNQQKSKIAADGRHFGFWIFEILLNIKRFFLTRTTTTTTTFYLALDITRS